jgi:hypothetical protein
VATSLDQQLFVGSSIAGKKGPLFTQGIPRTIRLKDRFPPIADINTLYSKVDELLNSPTPEQQ